MDNYLAAWSKEISYVEKTVNPNYSNYTSYDTKLHQQQQLQQLHQLQQLDPAATVTTPNYSNYTERLNAEVDNNFEISIILHILRKPNSIIVLLFIQNILKSLTSLPCRRLSSSLKQGIQFPLCKSFNKICFFYSMLVIVEMFRKRSLVYTAELPFTFT